MLRAYLAGNVIASTIVLFIIDFEVPCVLVSFLMG